jgi:trehalose/maltose hydrolase-like predicted phosphorylase
MNKSSLEIFHNFFSSNKHLLEKEDGNWPIERILYQLSYEHAKDSPITKQADKYFQSGRVDWNHYQQLNRQKDVELNPNFEVLTGHTGRVYGVHLI